MNVSLTIFTAFNVLILCLSFLIANSGAEEQYDPSMARLAVNEELERLDLTSETARTHYKQSCSEKRDFGGRVIGKVRVKDENKQIHGYLFKEAIEYSYEADVYSHCEAYNFNCYKVRQIIVDGEKRVLPRI